MILEDERLNLSQGPDLNWGQGICRGLREEKIENRAISIEYIKKESNIDEIRYDEVRKDFYQMVI